MHPAPSDQEWQRLDWQLKVARNVSRLAAKVLPLWPRLDLNDVPLTRPPPGGEALIMQCPRVSTNGCGAELFGDVTSACAFAGKRRAPQRRDAQKICLLLLYMFLTVAIPALDSIATTGRF